MKQAAAALLVLGTLGASSAHASFVLDFEGVGDGAQILDFYNGGTDSAGNSGTNYGVAFGSNALGLVDSDAGGGGNFANEPSPSTIMYFLSGTSVLNYAAGFVNGFSFFYTSSGTGMVNVYDGLNATGNLLGSIAILAQSGDNNCVGDPYGNYCNWTAAGVSFSGTAMSIDFGGATNGTGYDNITFGSDRPTVPEPATLALLGLGLAGIAGLRRKR